MSSKTLNLRTPIVRGETTIAEIRLHKPNVSALRGVSLNFLLNMHSDTISDVIPRICEPTLTPYEVATMDCADILQAGLVIASFFIPETDLELMP